MRAILLTAFSLNVFDPFADTDDFLPPPPMSGALGRFFAWLRLA